MNPIQSIDSIGAVGSPQLSVTSTEQKSSAPGSFADLLSELVTDVNGLQAKAGEMRGQLLTGEAANLHEVMIAAEQAGIATELLVELRNRLVETYQELMRMPV